MRFRKAQGGGGHARGCGCFITYWILSEVLSKDIIEASKIMETLEEVDRLVCGSMIYKNWQEGLKKLDYGGSLVAQWLRICLPMQGTQIRALVREDPTCHRATKPVCHSY